MIFHLHNNHFIVEESQAQGGQRDYMRKVAALESNPDQSDPKATGWVQEVVLFWFGFFFFLLFWAIPVVFGGSQSRG